MQTFFFWSLIGRTKKQKRMYGSRITDIQLNGFFTGTLQIFFFKTKWTAYNIYVGPRSGSHTRWCISVSPIAILILKTIKQRLLPIAEIVHRSMSLWDLFWGPTQMIRVWQMYINHLHVLLRYLTVWSIYHWYILYLILM